MQKNVTRSLASLGLFLLGLLLLPLTAQSTENPNLFPLGERESTLGNTGIAGIESGGALYYNPAALVELESLALSVAGSAYLSYDISAKPFFQVDDTNLDFKASGFTTVPSTTVSTYDLGRGKVMGVGVIVPEALVYDDHQNFETPNTKTDVALLQELSDLRLGAGLGWRINQKFAVGFAGFLTRYSDISQSFTQVATTTVADTVVTAQDFQNLSHLGLHLNFGGQYQVSPRLKLGTVLRLPLIRLGGTTKLLSIVSDVDGGTVTEERTLLEAAKTFRKIPWEVGFGLSYLPTQSWRLLVDVSVQGGNSYVEVPDDPDAELTAFNTQARINIGSRIALSEEVFLNLGTFYNPSAQRLVEDDAPLDQKLNFVGFSLGTELASGRTRTNLGFFMAKATKTGSVGSFTSRVSVTLLSAQVGFTYLLGEET